MTATPAPAPPAAKSRPVLLVPLLVGAAVSVTLGVYASLHPETGIGVNLAGFSGPKQAKSWLTTGVFVLALVQLFSALVIYGKIPGVRGPSWIGALHRWSGRGAFLLAVPVAVHCLYAFGFSVFDVRNIVHSLAGCFVFGAFAAKMLILPRHDAPGWALPVLGGSVFTAFSVLWLTSSLWFFTTSGITF